MTPSQKKNDDKNEQQNKKIPYHFGEKLRSVREHKGYTLKVVAQKAGVSESLVSQIERNHVSPAIDTLLALADVQQMAVQNTLTKANQKMGITAYLTADAVKDRLNKIIGGKDSSKFITAIVSAVNANPALQECTNQSILSAALLGQSLNLSPSPQMGFYYMIPYNDKDRGKVAQFQLGYKGYIQLAIRSGQYKSLNVLPIKKGELVGYDALNEEIEVNLIEDEEEREKAETIGYYATFTYLNGFRKSIYWSKKKMESHALRYSKGYAAHKGYTFWEKDFDSMACKTMLRQLISKWGLMSTDLEKAYAADMGVISEDGSVTYVENEDISVEPEKEEKPSKKDVKPPVESNPTESTPEQEKAATVADNDIANVFFGGNQ